MRVGFFSGVLLLSLGGCSVSSIEARKPATSSNECAADSDCGVSGVCGGGACRASEPGAFHTLLFEVTPPADVNAIGGVQFLKEITNIPETGGALDIPLDLSARVTGHASPVATRMCTPSFVDMNGQPLAESMDASLPIQVSLTPSASLLGLFASTYVAKATTLNADGSFVFSKNVPVGTYDIYVEPGAQPDAGCVVPPQLFRGLSIQNGTLKLALPEPLALELHVSWPLPAQNQAGGLDNWSVEVLDAPSGRVISNRVPLVAHVAGRQLDYAANVVYSPAAGDDPADPAQQYVRLSPPDSVVAPTVLMAREALSLFSPNVGQIAQFTAYPTPVDVSGQVTVRGSAMPAKASVTLVATKISGIDPGIFASFVRTVDTAADGTFDVVILPGSYRVYVVAPTSTNLAATTSTVWDVADSPAVQGGKVVELSGMAMIEGVVRAPGLQSAVVGASVQATVSPASISKNILDQAFGVIPFVPRATNDITNEFGKFVLFADPGTYDVSVRPQPSSGLAWLVQPQVVSPGADSGSPGPSSVDLTPMLLPLPIRYDGSVTVPGEKPDSRTPVPGSLVRAYCYLDAHGDVTDKASNAQSVLQVAEARADDQGRITLLIPAKLNPIAN